MIKKSLRLPDRGQYPDRSIMIETDLCGHEVYIGNGFLPARRGLTCLGTIASQAHDLLEQTAECLKLCGLTPGDLTEVIFYMKNLALNCEVKRLYKEFTSEAVLPPQPSFIGVSSLLHEAHIQLQFRAVKQDRLAALRKMFLNRRLNCWKRKEPKIWDRICDRIIEMDNEFVFSFGDEIFFLGSKFIVQEDGVKEFRGSGLITLA